METALTYGIYAAAAGLVVVLAMGIANLVRTDPQASSRSNQLMRLRILVQFVAIVLLVALGIVSGVFGRGG